MCADREENRGKGGHGLEHWQGKKSGGAFDNFQRYTGAHTGAHTRPGLSILVEPGQNNPARREQRFREEQTRETVHGPKFDQAILFFLCFISTLITLSIFPVHDSHIPPYHVLIVEPISTPVRRFHTHTTSRRQHHYQVCCVRWEFRFRDGIRPTMQRTHA